MTDSSHGAPDSKFDNKTPKTTTRRPSRRTLRIALTGSGVIVITGLLLFLFAGQYLQQLADGIVARALRDASTPTSTISLGAVDFNVWNNSLTLDSLSLRKHDASDSLAARYTLKIESIACEGVDWLDLLGGRGIALEAVKISRPALRYFATGAHFDNSELPESATLFRDANPASANKPTGVDEEPGPGPPPTIASDSAAAAGNSKRADSADLAKTVSTMIELPLAQSALAEFGFLRADSLTIEDGSIVVGHLRGDTLKRADSLSGIRLSAGGLRLDTAAGALHLASQILPTLRLEAENLIWRPRESDYCLRVAALRLAGAASALQCDSLRYAPEINDDSYFRKRRYRDDRFRLSLRQASIENLRMSSLLSGNGLHVGHILLDGARLDVLSDKRKAVDRTSSNPKMPQEILANLQLPLRIDSLLLKNAALSYGERHRRSGTPATMRFSDLQARLANLYSGAAASPDPQPAHLEAQAKLMGRGLITLNISMLPASPDFSMHYSGSLKKMDLRSLNSFLKVAEALRIEEGHTRRADFDIAVRNGRASGRVEAIYENLRITVLDEESLEEEGILGALTSFFANTFVVRSNNVPDEAGQMERGRVRYQRAADDAFFGYLWFALRGGLGEIVGF